MTGNASCGGSPTNHPGQRKDSAGEGLLGAGAGRRHDDEVGGEAALPGRGDVIPARLAAATAAPVPGMAARTPRRQPGVGSRAQEKRERASTTARERKGVAATVPKRRGRPQMAGGGRELQRRQVRGKGCARARRSSDGGWVRASAQPRASVAQWDSWAASGLCSWRTGAQAGDTRALLAIV